jgi:hypothetical protein
MNLPAEDGALLAWCYRRGVVSGRHETESGVSLKLSLNLAQYDYISRMVGADLIVKIA